VTLPHKCQPPLSSARQHRSYGDCLEVKREYYQNFSMLGCVTLLVWSYVTCPVKIVPDMTYNVSDGTLNLAQSISNTLLFDSSVVCG